MSIKYPNPIVFQRADPCIYRHTDGYYYFTASVPEYDRIEIRRSKTLAGLEDAKPYSTGKPLTGYLKRYAKQVRNASVGAVFED